MFTLFLQCCRVLSFLFEECHGILRNAVSLLDPLPDKPVFKGATAILNKYKYAHGPFTLEKVHALCYKFTLCNSNDVTYSNDIMGQVTLIACKKSTVSTYFRS